MKSLTSGGNTKHENCLFPLKYIPLVKFVISIPLLNPIQMAPLWSFSRKAKLIVFLIVYDTIKEGYLSNYGLHFKSWSVMLGKNLISGIRI